MFISIYWLSMIKNNQWLWTMCNIWLIMFSNGLYYDQSVTIVPRDTKNCSMLPCPGLCPRFFASTDQVIFNVSTGRSSFLKCPTVFFKMNRSSYLRHNQWWETINMDLPLQFVARRLDLPKLCWKRFPKARTSWLGRKAVKWTKVCESLNVTFLQTSHVGNQNRNPGWVLLT